MFIIGKVLQWFPLTIALFDILLFFMVLTAGNTGCTTLRCRVRVYYLNCYVQKRDVLRIRSLTTSYRKKNARCEFGVRTKDGSTNGEENGIHSNAGKNVIYIYITN
jgi:hypothetical protein